MKKIKTFKAFTLAEVLITLAIIGVVAALTIPTLITNYKKNLYVTQLKKEYNAITNAFRTTMAREGVTRLSETKLWSKIPLNGQVDLRSIQNTPALKEEFLKIFNVIEFPDAEAIAYKTLSGAALGQYKNSFCFADGACFLDMALLSTPSGKNCGTGHKCSSLKEFQEYYNTPTKLYQYSGNFTIDINGPKGPNTTGRDRFGFIIGNEGNLYPAGGIDAALLSGLPTYSYGNMINDNTNMLYWRYSNGWGCDPNNSRQPGTACAARIMEEGWKMNY